MSRRARSAPPVTRAALTSALVGTAVIAVGAFWLSFHALTDLALRSGVPREQAWVWPLIVDGVIIVSTVAVFALRGHSRVITTYPWALLLGGVVVSVVANGAHATLTETQVPDVIAVAVATVPPIALVAATHLSALLLDRTNPGAGSLSFPWPRRRPAPAAAAAKVETTPDAIAPAAQRVAKPADQRPSGRSRAMASEEQMRAWLDEQLAAGVKPTGASFAKRFGGSASTGRRRLAELKGELVDA
ncbi:DUF2637 domain-containing protein [Cellulosimicrobium sp. NPDC057127]|uniref:DUF2637 domain-containing protein n=1 Tax=Cellulosimicrobium sp. NPDC057127 TaxID=3346026 RepID=UPI003627DCDB